MNHLERQHSIGPHGAIKKTSGPTLGDFWTGEPFKPRIQHAERWQEALIDCVAQNELSFAQVASPSFTNLIHSGLKSMLYCRRGTLLERGSLLPFKSADLM